MRWSFETFKLFSRLTLAGLLVSTGAYGIGEKEERQQNASVEKYGSFAVDDAAIANDSGANWLSYGRTHDEQRYSPLKQINDSNLDKLGVTWSFPLPRAKSLVGTPLVVNGVMFFAADFSVVYALDAKTGEELWRFDPEVTRVAGKSLIGWPNNKGLAFWNDKVYVATMEGRLIALDAKTGKQIWAAQTLDNQPYPRYINGAPRAFDGKIIIGNGGADLYPIRGYVTTYDAETGEQLWRFYTVPGDPADGFENKAMEMAAKTWTGEWWQHGGGGTVWNGFTYDKKYNRILIGTGNGSPWNREIRSPEGGDNLFLSSVVALDADTGEYQWHYQTTPGESWDYNSSMDMVLAEISIGGASAEVIMHAPKNGFFYLLDRKTGKFISAEKIGKVSWAKSIDPVSGRPIENPGARYIDSEVEIWPDNFGTHNWQPMAFSPDTGLVYIPFREGSMIYSGIDLDAKSWQRMPYSTSTGLSSQSVLKPTQEPRGELLAWNPQQQKAAWRRPIDSSSVGGGALATAGNLVLQGHGNGNFIIYAADTGKVLWSYNANWGISAAPVTYSVGGEQYISIGVGWGAAAARIPLEKTPLWNYGSGVPTMVTFKLGGSAEDPLINLEQGPLVLFDDPSVEIDSALVKQGLMEFEVNCGVCHGYGMVSHGGTPDVRASKMAAYLPSLKAILQDGALERNGMPKFDHLSDQQITSIHAAIRYSVRSELRAEN